MAVRLDTTFEGAKHVLETAFNMKTVAFSTWGGKIANMGRIKEYNICNVGKGDDGDDDANITVTMSYEIAQVDDTGYLQEYPKNCTMDFYSNIADNEWTANMRMKIFENDYPSTVAVDKDSGVVYFVHIQPWGVEFKKFGILSDNDFEALEDINVRGPYRIRLNADAMFKVIDGSEGYNYLRKTMFVEFDCGRPVVLTPSDEAIANIDIPFI